MSVKTRLVLSIAVVLTVALGGLVAVIATLTSNQAQADGLRYASSLAALQAEEVEAGITRQRAAAQNLASTLGVLAAGRQGSRVVADRVERDMLAADPSLLGVWSAFEPDAFDGQDFANVGTPTSDATGRYVSYWFRDGANVSVTPLVDYTVPGAGDYYLLPRDSGTEVAIEPYLYEVAGEEVLLTSLTAPVRVGNEVVGVAGVDVPLADVQATVDAIRPYGVGRAVLVSDSGLVVASNRTGDEVGAEPQGDAAGVVSDVVTGGETVEATIGSTVFVAAPITVGEGQDWAVVLEIPESAILADAHSLRTTILIGALVTLLLAVLVGLLVARNVVGPLDALRRRMEEIADGDGDLTARVDEDRKDEFGRLGAAFNRFVAKVADTVAGIGRATGSLTEVSAGMSGVSGRLVEAVERTASQSQQVSAAAEQVSRNVQTVAAGAEEMGASIREIAQQRQRGRAGRRRRGDRREVHQRHGHPARRVLRGDRRRRQGHHLDRRADQPARAQRHHRGRPRRGGRQGLRRRRQRGQGAGAGDRARRPRTSAERIERDPGRHVRARSTAIGRIDEVIARINDIQTTIASAVEEQTATTNEMSRSVNEAAQGSGSIAQSIVTISNVSGETGADAARASESAAGVAEISAELSRLVGQFKV